MRMVQMRHPQHNLQAEVPETAVGHHSAAGWVLDEAERDVRCPTCHQPWPPPSPEQPNQAPAEPGASSSPTPKGRRGSKGVSE